MGRRIAILVSVGGLCFVLDQLTKAWAVRSLVGEPVQSFLGDTFRLGYTENTGVFLGLGDSLPQPVRFGLFVVLVGLGLLFGLYFVLTQSRLTRLQTTSMALILGGGVGNLVDRMFNDGVVVDFMNVGLGSLRTGVFNVADMGVTGGVLVLLAASFFHRENSETGGAETGADPGEPARSQDLP